MPGTIEEFTENAKVLMHLTQSAYELAVPDSASRYNRRLADMARNYRNPAFLLNTLGSIATSARFELVAQAKDTYKGLGMEGMDLTQDSVDQIRTRAMLISYITGPNSWSQQADRFTTVNNLLSVISGRSKKDDPETRRFLATLPGGMDIIQNPHGDEGAAYLSFPGIQLSSVAQVEYVGPDTKHATTLQRVEFGLMVRESVELAAA